jgi:hypothetical protein
MPRAKKVNSQYTIKKQASRKGQRRQVTTRRRDEDVFWNKVIEGFKKLLSPAFKRNGLNFRK